MVFSLPKSPFAFLTTPFPSPDNSASPFSPVSYIASGFGEQVDTSSLDTFSRFISPQVMLPRSPELLPQEGRHRFRVGNTSQGKTETMMALRRGTLTAKAAFRLNLKVVAGIFQNDQEVSDLFKEAALFDALYAQAGIEAEEIGLGTINDQSLAVVPSTEMAKLPAAAAISNDQVPLVANALDIFFVRELSAKDAAGALLGQAMGIPGAPELPSRQGVVISVDAHRDGQGNLMPKAVWTTGGP